MSAPDPVGGLRTVSYGGGVQSTALLVLAAEQRIDSRVFLFANVGEDSEDPATLTYLREHAAPFAARHGIELHELHRRRRDGTTETLYGRLTREGSRSLPIPVRMSDGAPGTRSCTRRAARPSARLVPHTDRRGRLRPPDRRWSPSSPSYARGRSTPRPDDPGRGPQ